MTLFAGMILVSLASAPLSAQQGCRFTTDPQRGYSQSTQTATGDFIHYLSGGIDYRCPDGVRILADSAAIFMGDNLAQLFGNVRFTDPQTELVARRAEYYADTRLLQAWSQVRLFDRTNGATISGEEMVLYRASPRRPLDRMIISGGAPHATVYLTEGGVERVVPYEVDADRFILEGRRFFRAGGSVVMDRATLHAVGDSLDFDQGLGIMSVFGNARVQDASFDLEAHTVTVLTPHGAVEEVLAREEAELVGDGVFLDAPAIRMFVEESQVQRLVALRWIPPVPDSAELAAREAAVAQARMAEAEAAEREVGAAPAVPGDTAEAAAALPRSRAVDGAPSAPVEPLLPRPSAIAESFHLWADSIDVRSPGQVLDRVIAVGGARGESITPPDSAVNEALPEVAREDWMEGDTIIVAFAPAVAPPTDSVAAPAADSTGPGVELESITSLGSARSLYKVPPSDSSQARAGGPPALHYVRASLIRIYLRDGEVTHMEVEGQTSGFHFEPTPTPRPDTTRLAPPDLSPHSATAESEHDRLGMGTSMEGGPPLSPAPAPRWRQR